jgi:hypothetical protein
MPEEKEVNEGAPIDTLPGANLEEAVDAEITNFLIEMRSDSGGFDDTNAARRGGFDDAGDEKRVEV